MAPFLPVAACKGKKKSVSGKEKVEKKCGRTEEWLLIEVSGVEHLRHVDLVGLPCAYLDLRLVVVGHVDQEEEVALVGIVGGVVLLSDGDAEDFLVLVFEGDQGFATGIHLHLDQAPERNGYWESYGITCSGGNLCYALHNSVQPTEIFFSNGTNIQYAAGFNFEEYEGGVPGHLTNLKKILLLSKRSKLNRGLIFE